MGIVYNMFKFDCKLILLLALSFLVLHLFKIINNVKNDVYFILEKLENNNIQETNTPININEEDILIDNNKILLSDLEDVNNFESSSTETESHKSSMHEKNT